jgi:hypothetical protein
LFILWRSISIQNFTVPCWLVQVLHPPQKSERPPYWNAWRYEIKKYGVEVTFNGMTSLLNFIKIYQFVQKLLGGTHKHTDRQAGDLKSLTFLFKESRLKTLSCRPDLLSCLRAELGRRLQSVWGRQETVWCKLRRIAGLILLWHVCDSLNWRYWNNNNNNFILCCCCNKTQQKLKYHIVLYLCEKFQFTRHIRIKLHYFQNFSDFLKVLR